MQLTARETEVLRCLAHGYTPDEIGDFLGITRETVRKIICNIKLKKRLQKSTELVACYWCAIMGTSLEEQRRQLLAGIMLVVFMISLPIDFITDRRHIVPARRYRIEQRYTPGRRSA